jgi:GNAT superfamily N-acetyltransferase
MKVMNSQNLRIRPMQETDLASVYGLIQNAIQVYYQPIYPVEAIEYFKSYHQKDNILNDAKNGYTVVAESAGEVLSTGTLLGTNLRRVYVNPEHQYQGIGKLVVRELEHQAQSNSLSTLDLSCSLVARRFWESLGYLVLKETHLIVSNDQKLHFYGMAKTLS